MSFINDSITIHMVKLITILMVLCAVKATAIKSGNSEIVPKSFEKQVTCVPSIYFEDWGDNAK